MKQLKRAMAFHLGRHLLLTSLILLLQLCLNSEAMPKDRVGVENSQEKGDDDDSSSEETVEDSDETRRRRRRDISSNGNNLLGGRAGIPGVPDPATIIKIAQLFQSVGEQIVPILLEAVLPGSESNGNRLSRDLALLTKMRRGLDEYSAEQNLAAM